MSNKLIKKRYNGHCLYRVIPDPRYLTLLTNGYGTLLADALSGYSGNVVHLTATPDEKYKLKNYDVTGASIEGNDLTFAGEDCTAKANFERYIWDLTLQNDGHGSIGASKLTGQSGDTITLSNTPNAGYNFSGYSVTGASLNGSTLTMNNQNATAKAWFSAKPTSALYFSSNGLTVSNTNKEGNLTVNKNISEFQYYIVKFNVSSKQFMSGFDYNIPSLNFHSLNWYESTRRPAVFTYKRNGITDYGSFTRNTANADIIYNSTYITVIPSANLPTIENNPYIRHVVDYTNNKLSSYYNNYYIGSGYLGNNNSTIDKLNFKTSGFEGAFYGPINVSKVRIAGFRDFTAATSYNG